MATTPLEAPIVDVLVRDFGGNYFFALDLFEQYERDPRTVDASWRTYFDEATGRSPDGANGGTIQAPAPAPNVPVAQAEVVANTAMAQALPTTVTAKPASRAIVFPTILPGDIAQPIRGGSLRIVENMEASLQVPTATSIRTVPVRALEENRGILNRHRELSGQGKISFTHLVGWAIVRALESFPRLNDAYGELEGKPHRIQRDAVRLGIAVDVRRKDGSRSLLVPNVKDANGLDFPGYVKAFDDLVTRSRNGTISPDEFVGTTISLTNPGTVGTTSSAPRLMPGQGVIIATGALDYPAEYRSMSPQTLSLLGIGKVMTMTSTYDHRIIQGAESGLFLSRIEELLRGEHRFYERVFEELGMPHRPVQWEIDSAPALGATAGATDLAIWKQAKVLQLIHAYRVRGHLVADLDPLRSTRAPHKELDPQTYGLTMWDLDREFITNGLSGKDRATLREILEVLRGTYCGVIGVEYMYIADTDRKEWLQQRMESARNATALEPAARRRVLDKLVEAEGFERFLHTKYVGHKRFSLEGGEALIPLLDRLLNDAARAGVREVVMGMPHRGRLNVLANIVGKPVAQIFNEFEGNVDPNVTQGSGDVKYHLGANGTHTADTGETLAVSLAPNPSHLEFVNPVVEGIVRAKQDALGDAAHDKVIPLLLHGDAAFAGEGIVAETMNLAGLAGYSTGGTIHVIVNNQIGFTTSVEDARSSTYCSDIAKMVHAPAFHVNGDDPEAVVAVASLAFEYRQRFHQDVVIDMVCYRRWGHNEGDEPSYTQPLMYAKIKNHASVGNIYGESLVRQKAVTREELDAVWQAKKAQMQREGDGSAFATIERKAVTPPPTFDPPTMMERLRQVLHALGAVPEGFEIHPKLMPHLKKRADLLEGKGQVDWATAEALAFGTLVIEGIPVRLSGQDSGRGTFSQRHSVLVDTKTGREYVPLNAVATPDARFEVVDSMLSEAAVMGFDFGYAVANHKALVMWEAQFGDFANVAQVIIDQFLAASDTKWGQPVGLTLLLPHGHEGQGPEHSSARIERFLTLCAENNMAVCYPSTPASYYHLLRRQARDVVERPLIIMTPKSLLRLPACTSPLSSLSEGGFAEVIDDHVDPGGVKRIVFTSGKVYYDLAKARDEQKIDDVALVRLEQLYPFPGPVLAELIRRYSAATDIVWVQEEPRNMGSWRFVRERFLDGEVPGADGVRLRYIGREASASPAPGSHKTHQVEQEQIVNEALTP